METVRSKWGYHIKRDDGKYLRVDHNFKTGISTYVWVSSIDGASCYDSAAIAERIAGDIR